MNKETFEKLSYIAIGIVALLLLMMIAKLVPEYMNIYFLAFSIVLLLLRFGGRTYFLTKDWKSRKEKKNK